MDAETVNVEAERADSSSLLQLYRAVLQLRRAEDALSVGTFATLDTGRDVLGFERAYQGRSFTILLNFSSLPQLVRLSLPRSARLVLSTSGAQRAIDERLLLEPNEGLVIRH
jgi:alpha-glucosidase